MTQATTLQEENLRLMNAAQREIVLTQWHKHQHDEFNFDYDVSGEGDRLDGFILKKGVWNPFMASGRYHARYFFYHTDLFLGKTVIEIGSGTGLMGLVMAKYGASKVVMSDISAESVENSKENLEKFGLTKVASVVRGDLFENIHIKADLITWMIPFFCGNPPEDDVISNSMIMTAQLFERFLIDAKKYLKEGGKIVLPSYSLGGDLTNPAIVGPKFGYKVKTTWVHNSINGIQRGMLYMHELELSK